jgi:hypothetical protein
MTMEEKHAYRLIRDLFAHKDSIFSELKRASSLSHSASVDGRRPRAISTDESNRKANMEARQRAILAAGATGGSRSRATSPAPSPRGHRRDRSSGGPETRFPIQTSPTSAGDARAARSSLTTAVRNSLEVPGGFDAPAPVETAAPTPLQTVSNGSAEHVPVAGGDSASEDFGINKRNSLGRSSHAGSNRFATARKSVGAGRGLTSVGIQEGSENRSSGVSLSDKPMDD